MEKYPRIYMSIFCLSLFACNAGNEFGQRNLNSQVKGANTQGEDAQTNSEKYSDTLDTGNHAPEASETGGGDHSDADLPQDLGNPEVAGSAEDLGDGHDLQPTAKMSRDGGKSGKMKSAEPVDIAGAFLAGGFAKRSAGITVIGYDAFSDRTFTTRHVGGADDALRLQLKSRMHIGYYDATANSFNEFTSANNIDITDPDVLTKFTYGFEVPDDQSHLLSLKYDDGNGRTQYMPVNYPSVLPVNTVNVKLVYGYGALRGDHVYGISSSPNDPSAVFVKKLNSVDPFNHNVASSAGEYFQVKNMSNNRILSVLPQSESQLIFAGAHGNINVNEGLNDGLILKFGNGTLGSDDHNSLHIKRGGLYSKNGYYICPLNQKYLKDLMIAIPKTALESPNAQKYLSKCQANILSPGGTDYWRTNFEWWSP